MRPDLDALQKNVDLTHELGFARASFDVKTHADLSLIEEAGRRLQ
jgi:NitT/TauT family transport system substrate-binding protein